MTPSEAVAPNDDMARAGFLAVWRAYTTKEKAILIELMWMSLLRAERYRPLFAAHESVVVVLCGGSGVDFSIFEQWRRDVLGA